MEEEEAGVAFPNINKCSTILYMMKNMIKTLAGTVQVGQKVVASLSVQEKSSLEKRWDIEHAYYSSALEGSKIDRKEFDKLAEKIA
ncbi:MAG: hypothetical protein AAB497_00115 [Patescibacteria group bacterium]